MKTMELLIKDTQPLNKSILYIHSMQNNCQKRTTSLQRGPISEISLYMKHSGGLGVLHSYIVYLIATF